MKNLPKTICIDLDIESLNVQNLLAIPARFDTASIDVTYSFYDVERSTRIYPGCGASIEIENAQVKDLFGYIEKSDGTIKLYTISVTKEQSELLTHLLDVDAIEALVWEAREGMEEDTRDYDLQDIV